MHKTRPPLSPYGPRPSGREAKRLGLHSKHTPKPTYATTGRMMNFTSSKVNPSGVMNRSRLGSKRWIYPSPRAGKTHFNLVRKTLSHAPPGACEGFHHKAEDRRGVGIGEAASSSISSDGYRPTTPLEHFSVFQEYLIITLD